MVYARRAQYASFPKGQRMRNDLGQGNFKNVSKAGNPPMKQSKNSVLTCEIMYAMFGQVMTMLMGIVGQAVLGLCERARRTDSA
jgi:hypothetical protein